MLFVCHFARTKRRLELSFITHAEYYEWQVISNGYQRKMSFIDWKSKKVSLNEYSANLDEESSDEDEIPEGDFTTSDGQQMLIDIEMLTGKSFVMLSELSTPAERDSLLLSDKDVGEIESNSGI